MPIYKGWSLHYCEKLLILFKVYNLYDAFLQRFYIWASNVSLLSLVIPKKTNLP